MSTMRRRALVLLAAAAAIGGLTACGGDEPGGDPTTAPEQTQTDDQATGDDAEEPSDDEPTDEEELGDGPPTGEAFAGDACTLGADAINAVFQLNDDPPPTAAVSDPYALFDGVSCLWEGSFSDTLQVDVSTYDDYIAISDSLIAPLSPSPVAELGPESWCVDGTMAVVAWRRDNVSVYMDKVPSCETGTELALAVDADLKAAGF